MFQSLTTARQQGFEGTISLPNVTRQPVISPSMRQIIPVMQQRPSKDLRYNCSTARHSAQWVQGYQAVPRWML